MGEDYTRRSCVCRLFGVWSETHRRSAGKGIVDSIVASKYNNNECKTYKGPLILLPFHVYLFCSFYSFTNDTQINHLYYILRRRLIMHSTMLQPSGRSAIPQSIYTVYHANASSSKPLPSVLIGTHITSSIQGC